MDTTSLFGLALLCAFAATLNGFAYHYANYKFQYNLERDFVYMAIIFALVALRYGSDTQACFLAVAAVFLTFFFAARGLNIARKFLDTRAVILPQAASPPSPSLTWDQIEELSKIKPSKHDQLTVETKQEGDNYLAKIKDDWAHGSGKTMHEALGDLMMRRRDYFNVRII